MPANLSPEYKQAEQAYRAAREPRERLELLKEMLRTIPKPRLIPDASPVAPFSRKTGRANEIGKEFAADDRRPHGVGAERLVDTRRQQNMCHYSGSEIKHPLRL